jgi:hypothetical protein
MPTTTKTKSAAIETALVALAKPAAYEDVLAKLSARDRQSVEKHIALAQAEPTPDHERLWKRLACDLFTLASHAVTTQGQQAMLFHVQDGKYRMQIFALEDPRDGRILVYAGDSIGEAVKLGLLRAPGKGEAPGGYVLGAAGGERVVVESLDANSSPEPKPWYKNMLGWGRKAIRITLPVNASDEQIRAAEALCALAARAQAKKAAGA